MASSSISLRASKSSTKSFPQNEYGYNTDMAITDDDALEYKLFSKATSEKQQGEMGLGIPERRMLQAGKKQHRETTDSARRSLQVAEQTIEMASSTLVEVQRQGQALQKAEFGIESMEKNVAEANRIVKFMRRWCCFQVICCCDCFDPDADMAATRKQRVQERVKQRAALEEGLAMQHEGQQKKVERLAKMGDPAYNYNEEAARSELFAARLAKKQNGFLKHESTIIPTVIGYGLPSEDAREIQEETRQQDEYIERIGTAVDTLKVMSVELSTELQGHIPQIEALNDKAHTTHDSLGTLARKATKI